MTCKTQTTETVKVFVLINQHGEYVATHDRDQLQEIWEGQVGDLDASTTGYRHVEISVCIPLPVLIIISESDVTPIISEEQP